MPAEQRLTVIVLAAQRDGQLDPLAANAGVSHKCLVPIAGKPLLAHVLAALAGVSGIASMRISVEAGAREKLGAVASASGLPVQFTLAADNLADSVYAAAEGAPGPVIVTTADNVLLTAGAVERVAARLDGSEDVVLALARREDVLAAHPEAQRLFYKFADGQYSNCNLYGLSRAGLKTAEAFRSGGHFAANPLRVVGALGLVNLILLRFGLVPLEHAMRRLTRRFGVRVSALILSDGEHAIDVDNERTYRIAAMLLEKRMASGVA